MNPSALSFEVESRDQGLQALGRVAETCPARVQSHPERRSAYLDTFDWRIYRNGGSLLSSREGRATVLRWKSLDGTPHHRLRVTEPPAFVWDLPASPLKTALEPLVEMRRLMTRLVLVFPSDTLEVLDVNQKIVARIRLEAATAIAPGSATPEATLPILLTADPVRGYDKQFRSLLSLLKRLPGLRPTASSQFDSALRLLGIEPSSSDHKLRIRLTPDIPSEAAARRIHARLLETIRLNEGGVREDLDTEFLHDFRVAVRRTRSALTQIKGVYPQDVTERFKPEFAWLGQVTGPKRDLDVYLLKMPEYRASLPEHIQEHLEPLQEYLSRHQGLEHRRLVQALDSERYVRLLQEWQEFLTDSNGRGSPDHAVAPQAEVPIGRTASTRIWKAYRKVLKRGRSIGEDSPAEPLHRLRIDCKKLRYLLEFFRSLYDEQEIGSLVKALKRLQDNLGDFNDLEIQQASLRRFADDMFQEGLATGDTLMAMGRLVDRLEAKQTEERQKFEREFAKFASKKNRARFRALFADQSTAAS